MTTKIRLPGNMEDTLRWYTKGTASTRHPGVLRSANDRQTYDGTRNPDPLVTVKPYTTQLRRTTEAQYPPSIRPKAKNRWFLIANIEKISRFKGYPDKGTAGNHRGKMETI